MILLLGLLHAHAEPQYGVLAPNTWTLTAEGPTLGPRDHTVVSRLRREEQGWWVGAPDVGGHCVGGQTLDAEAWVPDSAFLSVLSQPFEVAADGVRVSLRPGLPLQLEPRLGAMAIDGSVAVYANIPPSHFATGYDEPASFDAEPANNAETTYAQSTAIDTDAVRVLLAGRTGLITSEDGWEIRRPCMEIGSDGEVPAGVRAREPIDTSADPPVPEGVTLVALADVQNTKRTMPRAVRDQPDGVCRVRVIIDTKGEPQSVQYLSCPEPYRANSEEALMQWRWKPVLQGGQPVTAAFPIVLRYVTR